MSNCSFTSWQTMPDWTLYGFSAVRQIAQGSQWLIITKAKTIFAKHLVFVTLVAKAVVFIMVQ